LNNLIFNKNIEFLDISSHQVGDQLAFVLRKVLLHNTVLRVLHWDENETSYQGFKVFKFGLEKNFYIYQMPVPLSDISNLLHHIHEPEVDKKEPLMNLIKEIEILVSRNGILAESPNQKKKLKKTKSSNNIKLEISNEEEGKPKRPKRRSKKSKIKSEVELEINED